MKIAYVSDVIYPYIKGGAEKRLWDLSIRLAQRGHEVHIFGMKYWDGEDTIIKDGVYLHGVCQPQELYINGRRSIKEALYFALKLLFPLMKQKFDIIDCSEAPFFSSFSAKSCSFLKRTPLVITWFELWDDYWYEYLGDFKGIIGKSIERTTLKLPNIIISISEKVKNDLLSIGMDERKIKVIPCGIDFNGIQQIKPSDKEYDVVFVGGLIEHKNVDLLIKAIGIVRGKIREIKCGIIGEGPETEKLLNLTRALNLETNIEFLGSIDEHDTVISYLKSSRVFVLPSTREGFGIAVLEANASGCPAIVVKSKNNAATHLIYEGENGFITEAEEKSIAEKTLLLLTNENQRMYMGKKGIEYSERYDWEINVDNLEKIYKEVLHRDE